MSDMTVCPHCGGMNVGTKIKCHHCGRMLASLPGAPRDPHGERISTTATGGVRAAELSIETAGRNVVDITRHLERFTGEIGQSGLLHVFLPHATAGLAVMEVGSGSEADLGALVESLFPTELSYVHDHGRRGHGRDHVVPVFISPSLILPVDDGSLVLGQWQSVVIVDPNESNNHRRVRLSFLKGAV